MQSSLFFICTFILGTCLLIALNKVRKPACLIVDLTDKSYLLVKVLRQNKKDISLKPIPYTPFNLGTVISGGTYQTINIDLILTREIVVNHP